MKVLEEDEETYFAIYDINYKPSIFAKRKNIFAIRINYLILT